MPDEDGEHDGIRAGDAPEQSLDETGAIGSAPLNENESLRRDILACELYAAAERCVFGESRHLQLRRPYAAGRDRVSLRGRAQADAAALDATSTIRLDAEDVAALKAASARARPYRDGNRGIPGPGG